jgi:hypothetical protein
MYRHTPVPPLDMGSLRVRLFGVFLSPPYLVNSRHVVSGSRVSEPNTFKVKSSFLYKCETGMERFHVNHE